MTFCQWDNIYLNNNQIDSLETKGKNIKLENSFEEITQNAMWERQWSGKWELKTEIKKIQHMANWNSIRRKQREWCIDNN